jgi:hypothetical protein
MFRDSHYVRLAVLLLRAERDTAPRRTIATQPETTRARRQPGSPGRSSVPTAPRLLCTAVERSARGVFRSWPKTFHHMPSTLDRNAVTAEPFRQADMGRRSMFGAGRGSRAQPTSPQALPSRRSWLVDHSPPHPGRRPSRSTDGIRAAQADLLDALPGITSLNQTVIAADTTAGRGAAFICSRAPARVPTEQRRGDDRRWWLNSPVVPSIVHGLGRSGP